MLFLRLIANDWFFKRHDNHKNIVIDRVLVFYSKYRKA